MALHMNTQYQEPTQPEIKPYEILKTLLLLGLSYYFADVVFSNNLKNYTNQMPQWLALLTSGMFLLLGVSNGIGVFKRWRDSGQQEHREESQTHSDEHGHGHEHSHAHISWAVLALVALPVVLGKAIPSKPLGAAAINTNNLATSSLAVENVGPTILEPADWNIMEWKLAFQHLLHPEEWFSGKKADVLAFVVKSPDAPEGSFVAARFVMYHCAADARGVGLLVKWSGSDKLSQDSWVRIKGTMQVQTINNEKMLVIDANQVDDQVGVPETPYLYPFIRQNANSGG